MRALGVTVVGESIDRFGDRTEPAQRSELAELLLQVATWKANQAGLSVNETRGWWRRNVAPRAPAPPPLDSAELDAEVSP